MLERDGSGLRLSYQMPQTTKLKLYTISIALDVYFERHYIWRELILLSEIISVLIRASSILIIFVSVS